MENRKEIIEAVYKMLQAREIHPAGKFDEKGRFYATHNDLIDVREPSKKWPNSHMLACRTKKYVTAVCEKFNCNSIESLAQSV